MLQHTVRRNIAVVPAQAVAMPLLDESPLLRDCPPTVPVIIIGNGPSGICLSYLLSGYAPYLDPAAEHPNPILYQKLQKAKHLPIIEQDLEYLCEGLEGRSGNPVAVLFDTLLHPNADLGFEIPSVLQWKLEKQHHIPHVVLGKGKPGGAWHAMEGSILTISLGIWMELPGVNYRDITPEKRRNVTNDRATPDELSSYYKNYVKIMGLQKNFVDNAYVTSIQKLHRGHDVSFEKEDRIENDTKNGQRNRIENRFDPCSQNRTENSNSGRDKELKGFKNATENERGKTGEEDSRKKKDMEDIRDSRIPQGFSQGLWEVRGYQQLQGDTHIPFSLFAENVVLATGASDLPARLGVEGEDFPYVFHSVCDLGIAINHHENLGPASDPVLVVGAGLTAADAVLCAYNNSIPVLHTFRKQTDDPSLIFKQLPKTIYPEYHKVYHMMCSQTYLASPTVNPGANPAVHNASTKLHQDYTSFPEHCVHSFQPDMHCILRGSNGILRAFKVSMVLVLIGTYPSLSFLKEHGRYLGLDPSKPISCRHNPVDINPYTFECSAEPGLFAMGPLVGDNFVRFLKGGALGIASCLAKRLKQMKKKGKLIADEDDSRGGGGFV
ncbi:oxidative stress-induced growth inhibitor 2 isoform X2 [Ictalurus furcatus]|uniref:oxidative stress-induced growth inhibitor 2 isoform X2 n=1 Tax=Ictalurus furcatus TaxID=66913 RepID=UPI00234FFDE2|nr:oxidative stress-induced growth inhibitor 2 isoform X2 [Ictalurus furcatus]